MITAHEVNGHGRQDQCATGCNHSGILPVRSSACWQCLRRISPALVNFNHLSVVKMNTCKTDVNICLSISVVVVFSGSMWVSLEERVYGAEMTIQTWNGFLLQVLEVTTMGSYAGRQALGEVCHIFVDVFLWQLFPDRMQSDFQLITCLGLRLSLWYFCSMASSLESPIWRVWGQWFLSMNQGQLSCRHCCMTRAMWAGVSPSWKVKPWLHLYRTILVTSSVCNEVHFQVSILISVL